MGLARSVRACICSALIVRRNQDFGHIDQVSLAFRRTLGCTKNGAACIRQSAPVSMCHLRDRSSRFRVSYVSIPEIGRSSGSRLSIASYGRKLVTA